MGSFFSIGCCEGGTPWRYIDAGVVYPSACSTAGAAAIWGDTVFVIPISVRSTGFYCSILAALEDFRARIREAAAEFCCTIVGKTFRMLQRSERRVRQLCRRILFQAQAPRSVAERTAFGWRL